MTFSSTSKRSRGGIMAVVLIVLALLLVVAFVWFAKHRAAGKPAEAGAQPALTVSVTQSSRASWDDRLSLSGALTAWQEAVVSAEVSGLRLSEVLVDVGSVVTRGQPLAKLAQDTVMAELRKQEAAVAQARSGLAEATANADRARKIRDSGALSEQQINQYLTAEETGKANLAAAMAQLDSENIRLRQTSINAIDDGVISSRTATLGAVVSAGSELFRLVRQGRVEWRAEVSPQQLSVVRPGQKAVIVLPDGTNVTGAVRMTSPTLDVNSRNALVYVDLPNRNGVRAGMYAHGEILLGKRDATVLPQVCVVQRDGRTYVFELGADNKVIQHVVTTGRRAEGAIEIVDGLPAQARVVATGAAFLNDGDLVRVVDAPAAAASAPTAAPATQSGAR
ncbi:efflux RND transporter periplasmic adaptor subunit [Uliginosibacterium sp. H3]|uniref:Efflux RND transporter periplasmic adaptor subunit n=1 Tax=Uliginosibacterium silvisoli TaxID=3114758 RepID=A0ABU6K5F9_9RHOO|nr:efflux RND transporter periplasmic adaptor subunit [Uliginosibacterium sp. H3]